MKPRPFRPFRTWVRFPRSLRHKLILGIIGLISVIALFVLLYFPHVFQERAVAAVAAKAHTIGQMTAFSMAPGLEAGDLAQVHEAMVAARQHEEVAYLVLTDTMGTALVAFNRLRARRAAYQTGQDGPSPDGLVYRASTPVLLNGSRIGHLHLGISLATIRAAVAHSRITIAWISGLLFLVGTGGGAYLSLRVTRPLRQVTEAAEQIARGDFGQRAAVPTDDEVAAMARAFNHMVSQLVSAKEEAEEMARLKDTFLTNFSHEIRTPLTGIIGFAQVLQAEIDPQQAEFAQMIAANGRRLMDTINTVLELARLESNQRPLVPEPFELVEEVRTVLSTLRGASEEKGFPLVFVSHMPEQGVKTDRMALHYILHHLVGNAIKFTHQGQVTVELDSDETCFQLRIRDTGVGITPAFLPHLFGEFQQESAGLDRAHEGTGLGLALTQRLVVLLQGGIAVESTKHVGSVFTVTLPCQAAPAPARCPSPPAPVMLSAERRRKVLVVEDHRETQRLLRKLLEAEWDCRTTQAPQEALALAVRDRFDLLVLDLHLKDHLTGLDVLRRLRALPQYQHTPAIALTTGTLPEEADHLRAAGFTAHLAKPFRQEELSTVLHQVA